MTKECFESSVWTTGMMGKVRFNSGESRVWLSLPILRVDFDSETLTLKDDFSRHGSIIEHSYHYTEVDVYDRDGNLIGEAVEQVI